MNFTMKLSLTLKEAVGYAILIFALGIGQSLIINKAFFSVPTDLLLAQMKRDETVALKLIENCEVFSTASVLYHPNGKLDVSCIIDLKYFNTLTKMKKTLRKIKPRVAPKGV